MRGGRFSTFAALVVVFGFMAGACGDSRLPTSAAPAASPAPSSTSPTGDSAGSLTAADVLPEGTSFRFSDGPEAVARRAEAAARGRMGDSLLGFEQRVVSERSRKLGVLQVFVIDPADLPPVAEAEQSITLIAQALGIEGQVRRLVIEGSPGYLVTGRAGTVLQFQVMNVQVSFVGGFPEAAKRLAREIVETASND